MIYVLFTLSGFAGLIYESIWSRYLKLLLGHASYGQILTLIIFMGGLGAGSFIGGRWASRMKQPLLLYAGAEALIGLGALLFHGLFLGCQQALFQLLAASKLTGLAALALKTLAAALITLPWAIALGITFPALAIGLIRLSRDDGRNTLPVLYFSNSLGGAAGILSASYWLVPAFGTPGTLILAGMINILLAAVFYLQARSAADESLEPAEAEPEAQGLSGRQLTGLLLAVSMLTGLSSFLYEISWIRLLSLIIGSSSHSFDLMVAAFISGLAFGGLFARRLHQKLSQPLAVLALVHLLMWIAAALSLNLYEGLFGLINTSHLVFQASNEAYPVFSFFKYGLCLLLMFPASFFAGTTLPLITFTLLRSRGDNSMVGAVYGWNTLGAILGASLGGLLLMPLLQLKWTLLSGALLDLGLGLILLWVLRPGVLRLGLAALGSLALVLPSLTLPLNAFTLSSGRYRTHDSLMAPAAGDSVQIRDGRTATISFHRNLNRLIIKTNGKSDATLELSPVPGQPSDESTQMALAMFPINLFDKPYDAAMIGFGSGMSAHTLLGDPLLKKLDIIEIEPVMAELAKGFLPFNQRAYTSPKSHLVIDDAKAYFFAQQKQYDLIVSEPSNPWVSGVASLFSSEFYAYIRRFLTEKGVLVQWLHTYEFNDELLFSILKALQDQFAEIAIYGIPNGTGQMKNQIDVVIMASQQAIHFPPSRPELGELRQELARIGCRPEDYAPKYRLVTGKTLLPLLEKLNANSDFFPLVDNKAERSMYTKEHARLFEFLNDSPLYYQSFFEPDFAQALGQRLQERLGQGELVQALNQLEQLLMAADSGGDPELLKETFYALTQNFYQVLDFNHPVLRHYASYVAAAGNEAEALQFELLRAISRKQTEAANALIDRLSEGFQAPDLELSTIRVMAIHCLRHQDMPRFDRLLKRLALPHPKISETEKLYLLSLAKPGNKE
ncbi:MAG: spermine synthase [Candidatus Sericytochromatia bacterium]